MTYEELKILLTPDPQGNISVSATELAESANVTQLFNNYLPDETLSLSNASLQADDPNQILTLAGEMTTALLSLPTPTISSVWQVEASSFEVVISTADFPAQWAPKDCFPRLNTLFIDAFSFANPRYSLDSLKVNHGDLDRIEALLALPESTHVNSRLRKGLWLDADMALIDRVGVLANFLPESMPVSGPIGIFSDFEGAELPKMDLGYSGEAVVISAGSAYQLALRPRMLVGLFEGLEDEIYYITVSNRLGLEDRFYTHNTGFQVLAFPMRALTVSTDPAWLTFLGRPEDPPNLGLGELASFLLDEDPTAILPPPDSFPTIDWVSLHEFEFGIITTALNPGVPVKEYTLTQNGVTVSPLDVTEWSAFDGLVGFDHLLLTLDLAGLPYDSSIGAGLTAVATIAETPMEARIHFPSLAFRCGLPEGVIMDITALITDLVGDSLGLPSFQCTEFSFEAEPERKVYHFSAAMISDWTILEGFVVQGLWLRLGSENSVTGGGLGCTIQVAGVVLNLSAEYDGIGWAFEGQTASGEAVPIGDVITDVAAVFGVDSGIPAPIAGLTLYDLGMTFNTGTHTYTYECALHFPISDEYEDSIDIIADVEVVKEPQGYAKTFKGSLFVGPNTFNLIFDSDYNSEFFAAVYTRAPGDPLVNLKAMMATLTSDPTVIALTPDVDIDLISAFFGFGKISGLRKYIVGLEISVIINLSGLPLIGELFPEDARLGLQSLKTVVAAKDLTIPETRGFSEILAQAGVTLMPPTVATDDKALRKGTTFYAVLMIGGTPVPVNLPLDDSVPQGAVSPDRNGGATQAGDGTLWIQIQKRLGPIHFQRIGFAYREGALWFPLDVSLTVKVITLSLHGLSFGFPLTALSDISRFKPLFDLDGIGIRLDRNPLQISADFLRTTVKENGETYDEYAGAGMVLFKQLGISMMGIYADRKDDVSLFIYARIRAPLGGPPFFFVTGLAGGFGYNRALIAPPIREVGLFPLVLDAISGPAMPAPGSDARDYLSAKLYALRDDITPAGGQYFIAAGITFTVFKLIDAFALLIISFGENFRIDVLGFATLIVPPKFGATAATDPLAFVELAVKAAFSPDEGILSVEGMLTDNSYIFSPSCRVFGGFAFILWFGGPNAGDFVYSMGGYHPAFKRPAHYPVLPRVGFRWELGPIIIKGEMYYAMTGRAMMAGGALQACFEAGPVRAWFAAGAHFMISWKPFFFEGLIYAQLGAAVSFIKIELGVSVHLWGPNFGGKVSFKILFIKVSFRFGASYPSTALDPLPWQEFRDSFLPADDQVCSLSSGSGLSRSINEGSESDADERWIINPGEFKIETRSAIPIRNLAAGSAELESDPEANTRFGIAPMGGDAVGGLDTHHLVTIELMQGSTYEDTSAQFKLAPVLQHFPDGLWGEEFVGPTSDINAGPMVENLIAGYEILPRQPPEAGQSTTIPRQNPGFERYGQTDAFVWDVVTAYLADPQYVGQDPGQASARLDRLDATIETTITVRRDLASAFGLDSSIVANLDADAFDKHDYLGAPGIGTRNPAPIGNE